MKISIKKFVSILFLITSSYLIAQPSAFANGNNKVPKNSNIPLDQATASSNSSGKYKYVEVQGKNNSLRGQATSGSPIDIDANYSKNNSNNNTKAQQIKELNDTIKGLTGLDFLGNNNINMTNRSDAFETSLRTISSQISDFSNNFPKMSNNRKARKEIRGFKKFEGQVRNSFGLQDIDEY